jgi:hypothetical protein
LDLHDFDLLFGGRWEAFIGHPFDGPIKLIVIKVSRAAAFRPENTPFTF